MELNEELALSYYRPLKTVTAQHGFRLAQHIETGTLFAEKRLPARNAGVFRTLKEHPIPGTPRICELAEDGETLIVIEEYLAGDTLSELLDERGAFPEEEAAALTLALAKIVQELHHRTPAVAHRNICPSHLILSPDHVLKLVSFQDAELILPPQAGTDTSVTNASETATSGTDTPGTDTSGIYSGVQKDIHDIGELLKILLTGGTAAASEQTTSGQIPCVRANYMQTPAAQTRQKTSRPLAAFITKCTKQDSSDCFKNIDELLAELQGMQLCSEEKSNPTEQISVANRECKTEAQAESTQKSSTSVSSAEPASQGSPSWRRFLPPGFRSGNPSNMIVAALVYASMLFLMGAEIVYRMDDLMTTIPLFLAALGIIFFTGDYLGIQSFLPLTRRPRIFAKVIGIFLYDFLILLAALALSCAWYALASWVG
ncbi:MAG: hypothetical protein LUG56_01985 [Lachnospiraceae bacterium]|nr:hypothetical protein [Lachnospiraceae bacterium]